MTPIISCYNLIHRDLETALREIARAGFPAVSLFSRPPYVPVSLEAMDESAWRSLRAQLDRYGLAVPVVYYTLDLASNTGRETFARQVARARELGAGVIDTGAIAPQGESDAAWGERLADFIEQLQWAGQELTPLGMALCLETHGGATGTPEQCLALMEAVHSPAVRIAYDPANLLFYEGIPADHRLAELSPYIGHIHLKDQRGGKDVNDFPVIGEGEIDFSSILGHFQALEWAGPYTLERAPAPDEAALPKVLAQSLARMRRWLGVKE